MEASCLEPREDTADEGDAEAASERKPRRVERQTTNATGDDVRPVAIEEIELHAAIGQRPSVRFSDDASMRIKRGSSLAAGAWRAHRLHSSVGI